MALPQCPMALFVMLLVCCLMSGTGASTPSRILARADPTSSISISTQSADSGTGHKGDLILALADKDAVSAVNGYVQQSQGACDVPVPARRLGKRDVTASGCLLNIAQDLVSNLEKGQSLEALGPSLTNIDASTLIGNFKDPANQEVFSDFLVWAADAVPEVVPGIAQAQIIPASFYMFLLALANSQYIIFTGGALVISVTYLKDEPFTIHCPAAGSMYQPYCSRWYCAGSNGKCTNSIMKGCDCEDTSCPPMIETPRCETCGQADGDGNCASGDHKGCTCAMDGYLGAQAPPDGWYDEIVSIVATLPENSYQPSTTVIPHTATAGACNLITTSWATTPSGVSVATNLPYYSCDCEDGAGHAPSIYVKDSKTSMYCPGLPKEGGVTMTFVLVVIYMVPPVSGEPRYQFYAQKLDQEPLNHDNDCGNYPNNGPPFTEYNDPSFPPGDVSLIGPTGRPTQGYARKVPGSLALGANFGPVSCTFVEASYVGYANLDCGPGRTFTCHSPDPSIATQIVTNSGCDTYSRVLDVIATCPYG